MSWVFSSYHDKFERYFSGTLDVRFIKFQKGILREMKYNRDQNRKEPWDPSFFDMYFAKFPLTQIFDRMFLFYMSLNFFGFLSISELQN